ncbi:E3 ubiquitin-protein ligase parkin [Neolamprologus brichardi]|uniref:E3 ubiquitin-protein ligase parkin n=1 Tax=Neolamprologus brichardi TaxID=32507 RepID=UPI00164380C2|nr:E3 ubiquitin-protein ligase parkin [Neolamprologus brichardi]
MIVFVRFNLGPGVPVELQEEASVAQLKEVVGSQQGVRPERLRVLFAGRELQSTATLQGCDLPEQSTVHVVLPPSGASFQRLVQEHRAEDGEEEQGSLTRLDLSSSRLPADSEGGEGRAEGESVEEVQAGAHSSVRTCSTFFVFCKSCRSIEPGKLRARCRRCKQTALTLSRVRDPSQIMSLIKPGGVCVCVCVCVCLQEFYMKCASHPTSDDDLSVALDLIMTNTRGVPCIACTDVMGVVLVFQCSERHVICLDCFQRYCQTRLNDRQFVYHPVIGYSLPCAVGCDESLIKEVHHFRILGDEQYGRYLQYGAEECLLTTGGMMCPSPGCGAGLLPPDGSRKVECDPRLGCGFVFCRLCRGEYHEGACQAVTAPPTGEAAQVSWPVTEVVGR